MAKFITTKQITSELEDLIKKADDKLYLVSPFLKLSKNFQELLKFRDSKDKKTKIIFGKQELNPEQMNFLQGLRSVYLLFSEDLHAKCYMNGDKMIITSMNFYDYSMMNNKEMGILIEKSVAEDVKIYEDAWNEIEFIEVNSKPFDFISKPLTLSVDFKKDIKQEQKVSMQQPILTTPIVDNVNGGYCISCNTNLPFNAEKPLCRKCWSRDADEYVFGYCHSCGDKNKSSVEKPVCYKCYKKGVLN